MEFLGVSLKIAHRLTSSQPMLDFQLFLTYPFKYKEMKVKVPHIRGGGHFAIRAPPHADPRGEGTVPRCPIGSAYGVFYLFDLRLGS